MVRLNLLQQQQKTMLQMFGYTVTGTELCIITIQPSRLFSCFSNQRRVMSRRLGLTDPLNDSFRRKFDVSNSNIVVSATRLKYLNLNETLTS
jgi:hypothetical protein